MFSKTVYQGKIYNVFIPFQMCIIYLLKIYNQSTKDLKNKFLSFNSVNIEMPKTNYESKV